MSRRLALLVVAAAAAYSPSQARAADAVGHTLKTIQVAGSAPGEVRQVDVHLWYPADSQDAVTRPPSTYTSALYGKPLPNDWAPLSWKVTAATAREGAAFDARGGPYAPIVFSHGASNDPFDYADTLEAIARAGFIVAAPAHTGNTQDDVRLDYINALAGTRLFACRDGLPPRPLPALSAAGFPGADCSKASVPDSMADRVRDVSAVLDKLAEWYGGDVDVNRAGVMGHSRGTVTALAVAGGTVGWRFATDTPQTTCAPAKPADGLCWAGVHPDPRVKAIMGMAIGAAPINNGVNLGAITIPTLLINAEKDRNTVPIRTTIPAFDQLTATTDKERFEVPMAVHRSFDSTYCAQMQTAGAAFDSNHDGTVSAVEAASTGRPLDRWNLGLVGASFPRFISGKAIHYCSSATFTSPVNIKRLVAATANAEYTCPDADTDSTCGWTAPTAGPTSGDNTQLGICLDGVTSPPCVGRDSDDVKDTIVDKAVTFFGTRLERDGDGVPDATDNCPDTPNPAPQADADSDGIGDPCDEHPLGISPPVLTVPTGVTTNATGPGGATVTFTATANDDLDPSPTVSCAPASGTLFAIGATRVRCVATDSGENPSQPATFTVRVLGAGEQLSQLIADIVNSTRLPTAIKTQVAASLRSLLTGFDPAKPLHLRAACQGLKTFNTVLRLLAPTQAAAWTVDANRIRAVLAC